MVYVFYRAPYLEGWARESYKDLEDALRHYGDLKSKLGAHNVMPIVEEVFVEGIEFPPSKPENMDERSLLVEILKELKRVNANLRY